MPKTPDSNNEEEKKKVEATKPVSKKKEKEDLEKTDLEYDSDGIFIQDGSEALSRTVYSTGSLGLDILTGGFSPGLVQLWGGDGLGKTTLALIMASQVQKALNYENVRVYLHATEGRWNPRLLQMVPDMKMDSPTEKTPTGAPRPIFRITYPRSGEKMYDFILKTLSQEKIKFIHIIDSLNHLPCECNADKTMSDADKTASIASLNTKFFQKGSILLNVFGHCVFAISQIRDKLDMGNARVSGAGRHHGGGNIVNHASNLRLGLEKLWTDLMINENPNDSKSRVIGHIMSMKIEKTSNSGEAHSKARVPFIYNHGICLEREVASLGEAFGIISKKGNTFSYGGENIGVGVKQLVQFLTEHKDVSVKIAAEIKKMAGVTF